MLTVSFEFSAWRIHGLIGGSAAANAQSSSIRNREPFILGGFGTQPRGFEFV